MYFCYNRFPTDVKRRGLGDIINRKGCAGNSEFTFIYGKNPPESDGVNGGVNCAKGVKIIGLGKTPYKSYPTLRVSIVCIGVRTRRVSPSPADTDTEGPPSP
ncbi:hypothetical protein D7V94_11075 [Parablautia intestinalis]|uniref:Uncharacterized protein n=1 Tax=Parablautia intestinalis TaxID=2320100 RepID=A0A3A9AJ41_9FIRM|nr:hypothetical protein D7V94_11075 [Parablautia intestinalis]